METTATDCWRQLPFRESCPWQLQVSPLKPTGFSKPKRNVTLLTEQNVNLPISLTVGSAKETVIVSTEAPVVDTADSRIEMTMRE